MAEKVKENFDRFRSVNGDDWFTVSTHIASSIMRHLIPLRVRIFISLYWCVFFSPANKVRGKVIFSQVSVILFMGGGGMHAAQVHMPPPGMHVPPRHTCTPGTHAPPACMPPGTHAPWVDTTTCSQWAGSTYPTGMHSCYICHHGQPILTWKNESLFSAVTQQWFFILVSLGSLTYYQPFSSTCYQFRSTCI